MKLSIAEQDSIIQLLTRIYQDICAIETEFQLLVGDGDFRPRIDYFHDAIRAFSSQDPDHRPSGGRLSIEHLAYDVACLRYIQSKPLGNFKPNASALSPQSGLIQLDKNLAVKPARPDRSVRERISELYQHYAVLFSALLKPAADLDCNERVDDLEQDAQDITALIQQLDAIMKGKGSEEELHNLIAHLDDDSLRRALQEFMKRGKSAKKDDLKKAIQQLKSINTNKDKAIAALEKAHMNYALAQLGIYEDSKDMLKKLASQGMNLVGKFVESAMAKTQREIGR